MIIERSCIHGLAAGLAIASCPVLVLASEPQAGALTESSKNGAPMQSVQVRGTSSDSDLRRDFVAGKIVIGRKSIEESGVNNVHELLKREPAITISASGKLGLMGLPGYTQILVDGVPASAGKSPLDLDLVHVERIEIIKSSIAEFGPYGTAGTINIITRKISRKIATQLSLGGVGGANDQGGNFSWSTNHVDAGSPFRFNVHVSASEVAKHEKSVSDLSRLVPATAEYEAEHSDADGRTNTARLLAAGTLAWQLDKRHAVDLSPGLIALRIRTSNGEHYQRTAGAYNAALQSRSPFISFSAPLKWVFNPDSTSQWSATFSPTRVTVRRKAGRDDEFPGREHASRRNASEAKRSMDYFKLDHRLRAIAKHEIKAGATIWRTRERSTFSYWHGESPDRSMESLGTHRDALDRKISFFAQDDWRLSKDLAINLGLTGEKRKVAIDEGPYVSRSEYTLWAPSAHFAWKLNGDSNRQVRASLARTFTAPFLDQLTTRPTVHPLAPCPASILCGANTVEYADTTGNPALVPERAVGLNVSYEHYFTDDSMINIEAFSRRLDDVIGTEIRAQPVPWSSAPRFVARPANLGTARTHGLTIETQVRLSDLWESSPEVDIKGSVNLARSRISTLPGPDNHMADQTPWSAKLGAKYRFKNYPLRLSVDADWTPSEWVQTDVTRRLYSGRRRSLSAQLNWTIRPDMQMNLSAENLAARASSSIEEFQVADTFVTRAVTRDSSPKLGVTVNLKY